MGSLWSEHSRSWAQNLRVFSGHKPPKKPLCPLSKPSLPEQIHLFFPGFPSNFCRVIAHPADSLGNVPLQREIPFSVKVFVLPKWVYSCYFIKNPLKSNLLDEMESGKLLKQILAKGDGIKKPNPYNIFIMEYFTSPIVFHEISILTLFAGILF